MNDQKILRHAAPLRSQVVDGLRDAIIKGKFKPDCRLKEKELIAMFGVSRTVIREALRQLETENLILIEPQKGPKVREISKDEARQIYQIRQTLEVLAVKLFVETEKKGAIESLNRAHERLQIAFEIRNPKQLFEAKNNFFDVIYDNCGNTILKKLLKSLYSQLWRLRIMGLSHPDRSLDRQNRSKNNLSGLYEAIVSNDKAQAVLIMTREVADAESEAVRLI